MSTTDNIMRGIRAEHEWTSSGPDAAIALPAITIANSDGWAGVGFPKHTKFDKVAAVIDGLVLIDRDLEGLRIPNGAEYVAFRFVSELTGARESFVIVRNDVMPKPSELDVQAIWAT